ncbi:MAG: hypothetical protein AAFR51_15685 [Pseudomonadota bacterium]
MPRLNQSRVNEGSQLLITVGVGLLAVILFVAIIIWPSNAKPDLEELILGETPLGNTLNDATTTEYLQVLYRANPKASEQLHAEADALIAAGAEPDALGELVLGSYVDFTDGDEKHLLHADVSHWDTLVKMAQQGLKDLSNRAPKYCRMSYFETLQYKSEAAITEEFSNMIGYNSHGYHWAVRAQTELLKAVEDGRNNPKKYDRLNDADNQALQTAMLRMMQGPQASKIMRIQSMSPSDQKRAMANMNFCDVGVEMLSLYTTLPRETRERIMGEAQRDFDRGSLEGMAKGLLSGF